MILPAFTSLTGVVHALKGAKAACGETPTDAVAFYDTTPAIPNPICDKRCQECLRVLEGRPSLRHEVKP
jgi:hypothetical protein